MIKNMNLGVGEGAELLQKCHFLTILRKNIWFAIPVPKIKFAPPPQGKSALVFIF